MFHLRSPAPLPPQEQQPPSCCKGTAVYCRVQSREGSCCLQIAPVIYGAGWCSCPLAGSSTCHARMHTTLPAVHSVALAALVRPPGKAVRPGEVLVLVPRQKQLCCPLIALSCLLLQTGFCKAIDIEA